MRIDPERLNDARWAACSWRWMLWLSRGTAIYASGTTDEEATALADSVVRAFLGLTPEEWDEAIAEMDRVA